LTDKKHHTPRYRDDEQTYNVFKKRIQHQLEDELDFDFSDELDEELFLEVKRLLKK